MNRIVDSWESFLVSSLNDEKINFVAKAVTPWNVISIDALLFALSDHGIKINAQIAIAEHYTAGYMIDESSFVNCCSSYFKLPFSGNTDSLPRGRLGMTSYYKLISGLGSRKKGKIIYYSTYNHTVPEGALIESLARLTSRPTSICYSEEGVGAYMGTFDKSFQGVSGIHSVGELRAYIRYNVFGHYLFSLFHRNYTSLLFHDTLFGLRVNSSVLKYYRQVFDLRHSLGSIRIDPKVIEGSILVCTTAWRRNEIQFDEDINVLREVCSSLSNSGYNLLMKPHPRDKVFETYASEFNCRVLVSEGKTLEDICSIAHPKAVISFSSTTLVNATIFWGIPSFCLSDMLNRGNISPFYLDEIDSFKGTFKRYCRFVSKVEDIVDYLTEN